MLRRRLGIFFAIFAGVLLILYLDTDFNKDPQISLLLWSLGIGASFFYGIFRTDLVFPKAEEVWLELYFAGAL